MRCVRFSCGITSTSDAHCDLAPHQFTYVGIRNQGREGWLVVPAVVLWGISSYSTPLSALKHGAAHVTFSMSALGC